MSDNTLANIGQIAITVRDVDAAADFYEHKLGMQLLFKAPPGLAFFINGSVRLMPSAPEAGEFSPASSLEQGAPWMRRLHAHLISRPKPPRD
jgi:catechol 2,3-dioxygenase-like lactoylglutathione lyase family enzyme